MSDPRPDSVSLGGAPPFLPATPEDVEEGGPAEAEEAPVDPWRPASPPPPVASPSTVAAEWWASRDNGVAAARPESAPVADASPTVVTPPPPVATPPPMVERPVYPGPDASGASYAQPLSTVQVVAPIEEPIEEPTDAVTDAPTGAPTDALTDALTDTPTGAPTEAPTDEPIKADTPDKRPSALRSTIEWVVVGGTALALALLIRAVLFQTFFIPSASMVPTLKVHDRILVNKLAYDFHPVHRGDVVVFSRRGLHGIPDDEIKDLVKRVVGLPGETVSTSPDGHVEINGKQITENYLPAGTLTIPAITPTVIPPNHYWVMGDNRTNSADSRVFGPIDKNLIVGRAFILIWPFQDFSLL